MSPLLNNFSLKRCLLVVGLSLSCLFTLIEPAITQSLDFFERFIFWNLHIGTGLTALFLCSLSIKRLSLQYPLPLLILLSGTMGALAASPIFWALDTLYTEPQNDGWLDSLEAENGLAGLLAEFITVWPIMLAIWWLINIPLMYAKPQLQAQVPTPVPEPPPEDEQQRKRRVLLEQFYENLPEVLGHDIVAMSSDLHYLNVHTPKGNTLVLGSLSKHADALAEKGVQIHRSHWVAKQHVKKYVQSGSQAYCLMSNGLQLPVSRGQRKTVKAIFGGLGTNTAEIVSLAEQRKAH